MRPILIGTQQPVCASLAPQELFMTMLLKGAKKTPDMETSVFARKIDQFGMLIT